MPYEPIANLSRRGEKVAPFLSVQNITGMVIVAGPTWLLTLALPDLVRFALVVLTAMVGYLATIDMAGMSLADRMLWRVRGQLRMLQHPVLYPDALPGVVVTRATVLATPRDGPFRMLAASPLPAPRSRAVLDARAASALQQVNLRLAARDGRSVASNAAALVTRDAPLSADSGLEPALELVTRDAPLSADSGLEPEPEPTRAARIAA